MAYIMLENRHVSKVLHAELVDFDLDVLGLRMRVESWAAGESVVRGLSHVGLRWQVDVLVEPVIVIPGRRETGRIMTYPGRKG